MKPALVIFASTALAAAVSLGTSLYLAPENDAGRLDREEALAQRLRDADAVIERLQVQLGQLEDAILRQERTASALSAGSDRAELQGQIAELRARLDAERPAGLSVTLPDGREFETPAEALDRYLEARVENEVKRRAVEQRRQEFERFMPFAKVGFLRQVSRTANRLNLDKEQTRRLRESVSTAFDTAYPQIGVLLDPSRTQDEKSTAMVEVEDTFATVQNEAQSYMEPEQVEQLGGMQNQLSQGLTTLQTLGGMMGGGTAPGGPASSGGSSESGRQL